MGMESLRVRKCCCCASLYTGCLIIAIITLLYTTVAIFGISEDLYKRKDLYNDPDNVSYRVSLIYRGLMCAVSVLLCICLIYGTVKKNRNIIKGWVILQGIVCVVVFFSWCSIIYQLVVASSENKWIIGIVLVVTLLEFVVICYFWLVVWSHYLQLGDEEEEATRRNLPEGAKLSDVNASSNC